MSQATSRLPRWSVSYRWLVPIAVIAAFAVAVTGYMHPEWIPVVRSYLDRDNEIASSNHPPDTDASDTAHDHAGHDHAGHNESNSLEMSAQARKNIGLRVAKVELGPFTKTVSVPGMVAERPGRSTILVTAPMTGGITKIHAI